MAVAPIPPSAVHAYAARLGLTPGAADYLEVAIRAADTALRKDLAERTARADRTQRTRDRARQALADSR